MMGLLHKSNETLDLERQTFGFQFPFGLDLEKSEPQADSIAEMLAAEHRIIKGFASKPERDRQGELILSKGLDISEFLGDEDGYTGGFLNYDHTRHIVGVPLRKGTEVTEQGLFVTGELLKGKALCDEIWNDAVALQKGNLKVQRRLAFSVEGSVVARDQKDSTIIVKAIIRHVAVTANPVLRSATWEAFTKSWVEQVLTKGAYLGTPGVGDGGSVLAPESLEGKSKAAKKKQQYETWTEQEIEELLRRSKRYNKTAGYLAKILAHTVAG